jgi:hypothetical protein
VQPKLTGALPGMRRYFETYPFSCLEQKTSKAVGLRDKAMWTAVATPCRPTSTATAWRTTFRRAPATARGSDRLTAYVLAATHEAGFELPAAARERMLAGLRPSSKGASSASSGRPRPTSTCASSRRSRRCAPRPHAQPKMLGSINLTPNQWPTAAVIDWLSILQRVNGIPEQARRLEEAQQILRARLTYAGTTLKFSTEADDFWWWLMDSADANAAADPGAVLDDPAWKDELPRLVVGSLGRQKARGVADDHRQPVGLAGAGQVLGEVRVGARWRAARWPRQVPRAGVDGGGNHGRWGEGAGALARAMAVAPERATHEGSGKPWLTVQSLAAIPLKAPLRAGYGSRAASPRSSRRTRLALVARRRDARAARDRRAVRHDLGRAQRPGARRRHDPRLGLGRDSAIATRGERKEGSAWPAYEERSFEAFRSYFEFLPRGKHVVEYTVRLNNPGRFALPPTRVEAMYAPETFGERRMPRWRWRRERRCACAAGLARWPQAGRAAAPRPLPSLPRRCAPRTGRRT